MSGNDESSAMEGVMCVLFPTCSAEENPMFHPFPIGLAVMESAIGLKAKAG